MTHWVAVETSFEPVKKQNLYVFAVRSPYVKEANGIAGKSMLKEKFSGQPQNLNLKKQYLYAANTQGRNVFSGRFPNEIPLPIVILHKRL